jgi:TRAP-type mannitol/chloroaromatic compound transport system permease large subunit
MPFLYVVLGSMVVVYIWPQIALWLPGVVYGK